MEYKLSDDTWNEAEYNAIDRVIKSGFFTMGKEVAEYEEEFAKKMGSKYAIMSNSGSSANLLMIAALCYSGKLNRGDEVIVPAVSWSTTYFPLAQYGLKLKFADINYNTLNINIGEFEKAISDKTKAVMCVNLLGNPNEYKEIQEICDKKGIYLIEDNCEALGGEYFGKKLGTIGLLGSFSTFYSHHLCTMEGGVTVTDSEELYHYMLSIRAHGWTRNIPKTSKIYKKSDNDFYESFNFIMPGYNLRPLEIEAAIGKEQLKKMDDIIEVRRGNAKYFRKRIEELDEFYDVQQECGKSSWFGFAVILKDKLCGTRDRLIELLRANNVEVRPIVAGNFTRTSAIKYLDYEISGVLSVADIIHENGFFVGNHCKDNKKQIDLFIRLIKEHIYR
jgi:glycine hydroxymethyltransferase